MRAHYGVELQDAVDGRLDPTVRRELEAHLRTCVSCRTTYDRLRWVKDALGVACELEDVPPALASRIRAALDQDDRVVDAAVKQATGPRQHTRWVAALAAGVLLVAGVEFLTRARSNRQDVIAGVAKDFGRYRAGGRALDLVTDNGEQLRAFFAEAGLGFDARVLDLGMMGYRLVGGSLDVIDGHRVALFVYRTGADRVVLCAMYLGDGATKTGGELRQHAGISFHVHRVGGNTVVLWREGAVTCTLVSDGDSEEVVNLAFAKAMRAAS